MAKTFNEFYLEWRNSTRRYTRRSLLGAALNVLDQSNKAGIEGLGYLPWLSLLAIKWICQDRMLYDNVGLAITLDGYRNLVDRIWQAIDDGFAQESPGGPRPERPLGLQMRQLLRPQIGFQKGVWKGFVRESALIDQLEANHGLRKLFVAKTGLEPSAIQDLLFSTYGAVLRAPNINLLWYGPLYPMYPRATIEQFFSLIARDLDGLSSFCRSLPGATNKRWVETFEFPSLVRYPLLRAGDNFRCLHPMLYYRAMEGLVHTVLSEEGQDYMDRFSKLFEKHVLQEARTISGEFFSEDDLRSWLGNSSQVPDLLIHFPDDNIFVESKAGMFDESAMVAGSSEIFTSKMRAIRKAMAQGWAAASGLRKSPRAPAAVKSATNTFMLVVTNKDLGAAGGDVIAAMAPGQFEPEDSEALEALPLRHIYVLSIDDFERLIAAVRTGKVDLPSFIRRCVSDDSKFASMKLHFDGHFKSQGIPQGCSALVTNAYEQSTERIRAALEVSKPAS